VLVVARRASLSVRRSLRRVEPQRARRRPIIGAPRREEPRGRAESGRRACKGPFKRTFLKAVLQTSGASGRGRGVGRLPGARRGPWPGRPLVAPSIAAPRTGHPARRRPGPCGSRTRAPSRSRTPSRGSPLEDGAVRETDRVPSATCGCCDGSSRRRCPARRDARSRDRRPEAADQLTENNALVFN
jgi:hypothetical protein